MTDPEHAPPTEDPVGPVDSAASAAAHTVHELLPDAKVIVLVEQPGTGIGLSALGYDGTIDVLTTLAVESRSLQLGAGISDEAILAHGRAKWEATQA